MLGGTPVKLSDLVRSQPDGTPAIRFIEAIPESHGQLDPIRGWQFQKRGHHFGRHALILP
jgi:hypothetical protein